MYEVPDEVEIRRLFNDACNKLNIDGSEENMQNLVIYEMTDGTRTSADLERDEAYFDGGLFCLRFIHLVKSLGCKNLYINVIHEGHKYRDNYKDIYEGMKRHVDIYREYTKHHKVRLRFIGKYDVQINPKDVKGYDFRKSLKELEEMTANNKDLTVHFMINYSTRWASEEGKNFFKTLPDANVIIRHTKGYVNGDMWLHGKLNNNSFVYAQNGSSSINWSDRQLIYLIALSLRSMILNKGTHLSKKYKGTEREEIRRKREIELSLIHKYLYDEKIETKPPKRVIIFSPVGPEIYEF